MSRFPWGGLHVNALLNPIYYLMNNVDDSKLAGYENLNLGRTLLLGLFCGLVCLTAGCADSYGPQPVYQGAYASGYPGYAPAPRYGYGYPGYGYPAGSISVQIGDRPYYTRGAGYYVGRSYYVWRPGHWATRHGNRVWVHGHYVLRG